MAGFALRKKLRAHHRGSFHGKARIGTIRLSEKEMREIDRILAEMEAGKRTSHEKLLASLQKKD